MIVIQTQDLHKTYDETRVPVRAVSGISLAFEEGEFTCVVGPSGSGKTTFLNMVGGLDAPTQGHVFINHTNMTALSSKALIDFRLNNIGFVFQSYNLIPVLTARENVEFIMLLQKRSRSEREHRAIELLTLVGLADKINKRPGELSGGEQQRVAVARALASKPRFILADEPTANLDSKSTENLLDIMEKMNRDERMTFIFSTHDARVVSKAHRVITIEDGRVKSDIMQQPH
ncbi:MAG: ABC transporter ATP-binding protein [Bacteroidales bacterium]|jgi:putative ABC transport system ATP-binding protein|nr:ABC transporter ATP-binding protein [Bacteroidales bacterium]